MTVSLEKGKFYLTRSRIVIGPMDYGPSSHTFSTKHPPSLDDIRWSKFGLVQKVADYAHHEIIAELTLVKRDDPRAAMFKQWSTTRPEKRGVGADEVLVEIPQKAQNQNVKETKETDISRKECIAAAAVYLQGLIISLPSPARHHTILHSMSLSHVIAEQEEARAVQGFITSTGRFVNRVEGYYLARAAGQTKSKEVPELYSEDLW